MELKTGAATVEISVESSQKVINKSTYLYHFLEYAQRTLYYTPQILAQDVFISVPFKITRKERHLNVDEWIMKMCHIYIWNNIQ